MEEKERDGLDAIVVNASGCGTMVKDYGYLLRADHAWAGKAGAVSSLAKDVTGTQCQIDVTYTVVVTNHPGNDPTVSVRPCGQCGS